MLTVEKFLSPGCCFTNLKLKLVVERILLFDLAVCLNVTLSLPELLKANDYTETLKATHDF